ncbi:SubName: Full=Uncharacterized protein {ECO:0000313/EMBL:CCA69402.1} [Serendipita indica DSM 11827]|nr:SubName: Full=Uncharacterized protein {ECO:0000313/EMBL:CCA69402.1} [Serendipita indica DSM 11827]
MKLFALGASKNIGYFTTRHYLAAGHTVIFLLRSTTVFDDDETMKPYIQSNKAILVKGDGLVKSDVTNAWNKANEGGPVDLILSTIGAPIKFQFPRGFVITPPDLTTRCMFNLLQVVAESRPSPFPRMIAISSTGITKASHDALPVTMRLMYNVLLPAPHADKLGLERLLQYAMGRRWEENAEPEDSILPKGWEDSLPPAGFMPDIVVVRPAFLTDGEAKHEYKVSPDEYASYVISRKDVAHFIGERLLTEWSTWSGKIVNLGY